MRREDERQGSKKNSEKEGILYPEKRMTYSVRRKNWIQNLTIELLNLNGPH